MHAMWHTIAFLFGCLGGMFLSPYLSYNLLIWLSIVIFPAALFSYIRRWRGLVFVMFFVGALLGGVRGAYEYDLRSEYADSIGTTVRLIGRVSEDVEQGKRGGVNIRLDTVSINDRQYVGKVWLVVESAASILRSDVIVVEGRLNDGFAQFAASMRTETIIEIRRSWQRDPMLGVRNSFSQQVRSVLDDPMASLGLGFLTGERRGLPSDVLEVLKIVGLTHIIVASGYNVTILVRIVKRFFEKHSRYMTVFASLLLIGAFIGITGASPSMIRAGLVAFLALFAWYFGRTFHPVMLIGLSAVLTGMYDPSFVWGDMGWQLSFLAFAGVMLVAPIMQEYFFGKRKPGLIRQIIGETIAAQVCTLPLILYAFGQTSLVALAANVFVVPLIPLAMLGVFLLGVIAFITPPIASGVAIPVAFLLNYMLEIARLLAAVPGALVVYSASFWTMMVAYGVIVGGVLYMKNRTDFVLAKASVIE